MSIQSPGTSPASIDDGFVLSKCDYFLDLQLWPIRSRIDPVRWLQNFSEDEKDHAVHLLNGFTYLCPNLVDEMFRGAFQRLSLDVVSSGTPLLTAQGIWNSFLDNVLLVPVRGETPSTADSGFAYARRARQLLKIPEDRILLPVDALRLIIEKGPRPVVFVDDFVGSGSQFIKTWRHNHEGLKAAFSVVAPLLQSAAFFYIPIVATEAGISAIHEAAPEVLVKPANTLSARYSALAVDSLIWPVRLRPTALNFVRNASMRAGIPDVGGQEHDWRGQNKAGLCLAIGDSVPDATLPLFYWTENDWKPLIQKA
jgi:hypothetical protein